MRLITKRFVLHDFTESDVPAFIDYHNDPRSRELYGPGENRQDHALELVRLFMTWANEVPRFNYQLAISHIDGSLVGCCGLRMHDCGPDKAEFGVELAPVYWGRFGYAIEVMAKLVDFGFSELGLSEVFGKTVSANSNITRLASTFGAIPTITETPDWMSDKGWQQVEWRIHKEQWVNRRSNKLFNNALRAGTSPSASPH